MYIYEHKNWPRFTWDTNSLSELLAKVRFNQGVLLGKMSQLGFDMQEAADLLTQTENIIKSSEIEGEKLNPEDVRSSIAKRLGLDIAGQVSVTRSVEGIVEMHVEAVKDCHSPLTFNKLYRWHHLLFPDGYSGLEQIRVGALRKDEKGRMRVLSGRLGNVKIHFEAPIAEALPVHVENFISWFNEKSQEDLLIRAGIAHLWFVTLHPFEDGNGRLARCITDVVLARSDNQPNRYYSMSMQIQRERKDYYAILEATQKNGLDITPWLTWFITCLNRSIKAADISLKFILNKAKFWEQNSDKQLNDRQIIILNLLFDGYSEKLTSTKWAKITKCSQDTATRDIQDLISKSILMKSAEGGRSTNYVLKDFPINSLT